MESANILVCEDERLVARDIESVLERSGYRIIGTAANGQDALRLARENPPDLALLDIRLKGTMSGIDVAGALAEEFVVIKISDFGKGIALENLQRVFEPCFSASGAPLCAGLGLSVAYAAVQQHAGWMTIESSPASGTQTSVYLPIQKPKV